MYKDPQKHNRNSKSFGRYASEATKDGLLCASWHRHAVHMRGKRAARRACVARAPQLPAALRRASAPGGAVAHALRCTPRMPQADEQRTERGEARGEGDEAVRGFAGAWSPGVHSEIKGIIIIVGLAAVCACCSRLLYPSDSSAESIGRTFG